MNNQNSFDETIEIYSLLEDIKKEYNCTIIKILQKNEPSLFKNIHTIPKLKKIQINRGLGLMAQNKNFVKKSIEEFTNITGQKPIITKSKKAIATFKIREDMELGLTVTLRNEKMYAFLTKLIFFTFAQIRDFRGLSIRSFDKAGNYNIGLKEQLIFPEINYEDVEQIQGFTINLVISSTNRKVHSRTFNKILNGIILLKLLKFPLNDCGQYDKYSNLDKINQNWDKKKDLRRKRWSQE